MPVEATITVLMFTGSHTPILRSTCGVPAGTFLCLIMPELDGQQQDTGASLGAISKERTEWWQTKCTIDVNVLFTHLNIKYTYMIMCIHIYIYMYI